MRFGIVGASGCIFPKNRTYIYLEANKYLKKPHAMKLRILPAVLILIPMLGVSLTHAQNKEIDRELYNLCSQFPMNSRCRGFNVPIPLEQRSGYEAECLFQFSETERNGDCKVAVTNEGLSVYLEQGEPLELLDNQRPSRELKIPANQILALGYQQWSGEGFSSRVGSNFWTIEAGFVVEPSSPQNNRSNVLRIFASEKFRDSINQLASLSVSTKTLLNRDVVAQIGMVESTGDTSQQVKQLLKTRKCIRCDLRGANLEDADLEQVNLEGANLQGAKLAKADLRRAYLVGANLSGASLNQANLAAAKLILTDLSEADLQDASLQGASLQRANLQGASLIATKLTAPTTMQDANLRNAIARSSRLDGANLERADLQGANLENASLRRVDVPVDPFTNKTFSRALVGTIFDPAGLPTSRTRSFRFKTNLSGANLTAANLSGARLSHVLLSKAELREANLMGAKIDDTNLTDSNICGATMPDGSRSGQNCQ